MITKHDFGELNIADFDTVEKNVTLNFTEKYAYIAFHDNLAVYRIDKQFLFALDKAMPSLHALSTEILENMLNQYFKSIYDRNVDNDGSTFSMLNKDKLYVVYCSTENIQCLTTVVFNEDGSKYLELELPAHIWYYLIDHFVERSYEPEITIRSVIVTPKLASLPKDSIANQILEFIQKFRSHTVDSIFDLMSSDYSYHFAVILQAVFPGGSIRLAAPYHYCVYKYGDTEFDIKGIYIGPSTDFISLTEMSKELFGTLTHNPTCPKLTDVYWNCREFLVCNAKPATVLQYDALYKRGEFCKILH